MTGQEPPDVATAQAPRLILDAGYGFYDSTLRFDDRVDADVWQHTANVGVSWEQWPGWTMRFGVGAVVAGGLKLADYHHDFLPGVLLSFSSNWRLLQADGAVPYLDATGSLAASWTATEASGSNSSLDYKAFDLRLGLRAGWLLWERFSPYLVARAFGGPVFWEIDGKSVLGTDVYHFQVGAGVSFFVKQVGLYLEASPLGEQSYFGGLSLAL